MVLLILLEAVDLHENGLDSLCQVGDRLLQAFIGLSLSLCLIMNADRSGRLLVHTSNSCLTRLIGSKSHPQLVDWARHGSQSQLELLVVVDPHLVKNKNYNDYYYYYY